MLAADPCLQLANFMPVATLSFAAELAPFFSALHCMLVQRPRGHGLGSQGECYLPE